MHIIQLDHITINHAGRVIFRDLTWAIDDRERVGLVGPNGAGKSSLLKAITGELLLAEGSVVRQRGVTLGILPQEVVLTRGHTLIEEALALPPDLAAVEVELARIEEMLADPAVYNDLEKLQRVIDRQSKALENYEALGGSRHASRVEEILALLGFTPADYDLPSNTLSGGERSRLQLMALMLGRPNLLLLDEPTNNLDIPSAEVLEEALDGFDGAMLIISHDRYFLDRVVDRIVELDEGILCSFDGGYTDYLLERGKVTSLT